MFIGRKAKISFEKSSQVIKPRAFINVQCYVDKDEISMDQKSTCENK